VTSLLRGQEGQSRRCLSEEQASSSEYPQEAGKEKREDGGRALSNKREDSVAQTAVPHKQRSREDCGTRPSPGELRRAHGCSHKQNPCSESIIAAIDTVGSFQVCHKRSACCASAQDARHLVSCSAGGRSNASSLAGKSHNLSLPPSIVSPISLSLSLLRATLHLTRMTHVESTH